MEMISKMLRNTNIATTINDKAQFYFGEFVWTENITNWMFHIINDDALVDCFVQIFFPLDLPFNLLSVSLDINVAVA